MRKICAVYELTEKKGNLRRRKNWDQIRSRYKLDKKNLSNEN